MESGTSHRHRGGRVVVADRPCAVDLLDQQHPSHGVQQGHVDRRNAARPGLEFRVQPIRATDDEGHIVALQLPLLELLGPGPPWSAGAPLVQHHHAGAPRQHSSMRLRSACSSVRKGFGATGLGLTVFSSTRLSGGKRLAVVIGGLCPVGHALPWHSHNRQPCLAHPISWMTAGQGFAAAVVLPAAASLAGGLLTTRVLI